MTKKYDFIIAGGGTSGIIIFSEVPDINSFIGIFLIMVSGIFVVFRENTREKLVVAKTTLRT